MSMKGKAGRTQGRRRKPRPHALGDLLDPEQRARLAKRLRHGRKLDAKRGGGWERRRNLDSYSKELNINLRKALIDQALKTRGTMRVLDIGCGRCYALAEIKAFLRAAGAKAEVEGLRLSRGIPIDTERDFSKEAIVGDRIRVGSIENYRFGRKFDFITSIMGLQYAANIPFAVQKVCNALNRGGRAVLQVKSDQVSVPMLVSMKRQGFEVAPLRVTADIYVFDIANRKGGALDLSRYVKKALAGPIGERMEYNSPEREALKNFIGWIKKGS